MKKLMLLLLPICVMMFSTCSEDCETGYTGSGCTTQITPSRIVISNIRVSSFPEVDGNGSLWDDFTSKPDVYPVFYDVDNNILYNPGTHIEEANSGVNYDFSCSIAIYEVTERYGVALYDYDSIGDDDFMIGIEFNIYDSSNGFPSEVELFLGSTRIYLTIEYSF